MSTDDSSAAYAQVSQQDRGENALRPCSLVICGPSGVGKGTLIKKVMESSDRFGFSCSHTTREAREGEKVGHHATRTCLLFAVIANNCSANGLPWNLAKGAASDQLIRVLGCGDKGV